MKTKSRNIHQNLIDSCKAGDRKAQFEIYKLYYKAMYNTALRMLNDSQEAEDVMQESFLQAFDKISTYKEEVSFGAWLKKIVVNKALDMIRKNKIYTCDIEENPITIEDDSGIENNEIDLIEKVSAIKNAINKLPEKDRTLLNLYLVEGYDQQEISDFLGISYAAVRTGYSRAKNKLKEMLEFDTLLK